MVRMVPTLSVLNAWKDTFKDNDTRLSPEHMELFGYLDLMNNLDGLELQHVQHKLGYAQAKLHRTADALKKLGLIELLDSPLDGRQKQVRLTKMGLKFAERIAELEQGKSGELFLSIAQAIAADVHSSTTHRTIRKEAMRPDSKPMVPKDMLKAALEKRGEKNVQVGRNYVKTDRGTVTFPSLLKKTEHTSMLDFTVAVGNGEFDLDEVLKPKVRYRDDSDDPAGELAKLYDQYGAAAVNQNPELRQRQHLLTSQIARNSPQPKRSKADVTVSVRSVAAAKAQLSRPLVKVFNFKAPEGVTEKWWDLYEAADDAGKEALVNASFSNSREYRHMSRVVKLGKIKWSTLIKRGKTRGRFQITSEEPKVLEALEALEAEKNETKGK